MSFLFDDLFYVISRVIKTSNQIKDKARNWKGIFKNEPCFIIGNSPSLNDFDISLLKDNFTIGINRSFIKLETTILLWQDIELYMSSKDILKRISSVLYAKASSDPAGIAVQYQLVPGKFQLTENPSILYGSGSSGPLAFELAYVLGCDPIILLGCDCKYRQEKTDFYGINKDHKPHTLNLCNRGLSWMKSLDVDRRVTFIENVDEFENVLKKTDKKQQMKFKEKLLK